MKPDIIVVYVYPNHSYRELGKWFVHSYNVCTPAKNHRTLIVTQDWDADDEARRMFESLPQVQFMRHDNSGYDIGAFQHAAREHPCDLMVFFGATAYLKQVEWLDRVVESFAKHGDTLFGSMGHAGSGPAIHPHIRTTGFWMSPALLNQYPKVIAEAGQRYGFEHGPECLTTWILGLNKIPWVVTKIGEYQIPEWGSIPLGYQTGDQSNLLTGDRMTRPPHHPTP